MSDEEAFLKAVLADPDSDGPRLVFADWLQEQGDQLRADFIRVDCEYARLDRDDPRYQGVSNRRHRLRMKYEPVWGKSLPEWSRDLRPRLHRGFGGIVHTSISNFVRLAPRALRVMPIQQAELNNFSTQGVAKLVASKHLAKLRRLDLTEPDLSTDDVRALALCPHLAGLTELRLCLLGGRLTAAMAASLAGSATLAGLARLDLVAGDADRTGVEPLRDRFGERLTVVLTG